MRNRMAFTLVETTVVVALIAALTAISIPRASGFVDSIEVRGAVTEIESMFSLARHSAIARGSQVTLIIDAAARTLSVAAGAQPPLLGEEEEQLLATWQRRSTKRVSEVVVTQPRWGAVDFWSRTHVAKERVGIQRIVAQEVIRASQEPAGSRFGHGVDDAAAVAGPFS